MLFTWFRVILLSIAILLAVSPFTPCQAKKTSTMTIALPAELILSSLKDILPLDIDEPNNHIEGRLILNSINHLVMGDNTAVLEGLVIGKNVSILTKVGNQDLRIKVGDLYLPLTCDLQFRFDSKSKTLFVKPRLRTPAKDVVGDMAHSVTSLLTLLNNREYPVSLTSLDTFSARVGDQDISVDMEPVDVQVSKGQLIVKMVPRFSKTN